MNPLLLLAGGLQMYGLKQGSDYFTNRSREAEQGRRTDFLNQIDESMNPPPPGQTDIDRNMQFTKQLLANPDFDRMSGGLLQQAMQNQNANNRFQQEFNSLSAYQQEQLALQQQRQQQLQQQAMMMTPQQKAEQVRTMRTEYNKAQQGFIDLGTQYRSLMQSLAKGKTGADTLATIFQTMKVLDPGGVVQQGDIKSVLSSFGFEENIINKLLASGGEGMSYESRKKIADAMTTIYQQRYSDAMKMRQEYENVTAAWLGSMGIEYNPVSVFGAVNLEPFELPEFEGAPSAFSGGSNSPKFDKAPDGFDFNDPTKPRPGNPGRGAR